MFQAMKHTKIMPFSNIRQGNRQITASADIRKGIIYLNNSRFEKLNGLQQKFVILHEKGHINLKTTDELKADEFAFRKIITENPNVSMRQLADCIAQVLQFDKKQDIERYENILKMAFQYDYQYNGNKKALQSLRQLQQKKTTSIPAKAAFEGTTVKEVRDDHDTFTILGMIVLIVVLSIAYLKLSR